ncbi:hypothetical protein ACF0H5_016882 [Mactra antiquata]
MVRYDQEWFEFVSTKVNKNFHDMSPDQSATILPDVVSTAIEISPRGKAGGFDKIQYEHLNHCKDFISPILANMFTKMLRTGYVPVQLKRGVITTIHKGGNKRNTTQITIVPSP